MTKPEELVVRRIRNGTVIDHIPAGQALNVLKILGVRGVEDFMIALMMNAKSSKLGRKDIVKMEGRQLIPEEVDKIALIAPEATINIIKDYRVTEKMKVRLPDEIEGIVRCTNPNCISRQPREPITPSFKVISRNPTLLVCKYCGTYVSHKDVVAQYAALAGS